MAKRGPKKGTPSPIKGRASPLKGKPSNRKGSPNKATKAVKDALNECYEQLGGVQGMVTWAKRNDANRGEFYKLWIKMLPHQLQVAGNNGRDLFAQFAKAVEKKMNDSNS